MSTDRQAANERIAELERELAASQALCRKFAQALEFVIADAWLGYGQEYPDQTALLSAHPGSLK